MATGVLAILGSGETAPGMTKVHRELLARRTPVVAVNLDSVYGFQENVPQMSEKLESYFDVSLHTVMTTLHFARFDTASELERALFKQEVRRANFVFAGPGSPSYALAQWTPLDLGSDLVSVLDADGTLCFSSAAALTLGAFTAPIYEIYKVGADPYWLAGLNLMASFDLACVVIPHFDNHEGANYDTRFCYLGERRLEVLERQLPDGVATLGVDEHTALILDRAADTVRVTGRANGFWRRNGVVRVLERASTTPLAQLRSSEAAPRVPAAAPVPLLGDDAERLGQIALGDGPDALEALAALVGLARRAGPGHLDPAPLIAGVLAVRRHARALGQYQLADDLRDALHSAGVDVHDGPDESTWSTR